MLPTHHTAPAGRANAAAAALAGRNQKREADRRAVREAQDALRAVDALTTEPGSGSGRTRAGGCTTRRYRAAGSTAWTCQTRSQYSRMLRSDENHPIRATFRIDFRAHPSGSVYAPLTFAWHAAYAE